MATTPTQQRQNRRPKKLTQYAEQLLEKQKTKREYGMREKQFRRYFQMAAKFRGQTGKILLQTLERRIDNVLYRAGVAKSRAHARQLVGHRHFLVNGSRLNIPSYLVQVNDVIEPYKKGSIELESPTVEARWLKIDKKNGKVSVERLPIDEDLPIEFDTQKIIEFYSR